MSDERDVSKRATPAGAPPPHTPLIGQVSETELGDLFDLALKQEPSEAPADQRNPALSSLAEAELTAITASAQRAAAPAPEPKAKPAPAPAPITPAEALPTSALFHIPPIGPPQRAVAWSSLSAGLRAAVVGGGLLLLVLLGTSALLLRTTLRGSQAGAPPREAAPAPGAEGSAAPAQGSAAQGSAAQGSAALAQGSAALAQGRAVPAQGSAAQGSAAQASAPQAPVGGAQGVTAAQSAGPGSAGPAQPGRSSPGRASAERAKPAPVEIRDQLEPKDILAVVVAHRPAVVRCVEAEQARQPELTGILVMTIKILTDGSVASTSARTEAFEGTPLEACLEAEILTWSFPRHKQALPPIDFPFKL